LRRIKHRRRRSSGEVPATAPPSYGSRRRGGSNAPSFASWDALKRPRARHAAAVTILSGTCAASQGVEQLVRSAAKLCHVDRPAWHWPHPSATRAKTPLGENSRRSRSLLFLHPAPCSFALLNPRPLAVMFSRKPPATF
jgi:hypothetical protein